MSDTAEGPGWWQASDGRWYPPTAVPASTPPPPVGAAAPLPGPAVPPALAVVVQVAFAFTAAMYVLALVMTQRARSTFDAWWSEPGDIGLLRAAVDADERLTSLGPLTAGTNLVLLVLVVVWMHRSHGATDRLRPGERKWGRGWTIGGWFIPIANLVIPKGVANEIERIATAPRVGGVLAPGWRSVRTSPVGWLWWILFVVGFLATRVAASDMDQAVEDLDGAAALDAYGLAIGAGVVLVGAAVCGAIFVGRISRRLSPAAFAASYDEDPYARS